MWKTVVKDEVAVDVSYKKVVEGITIRTSAPPEERPIGYALLAKIIDVWLHRLISFQEGGYAPGASHVLREGTSWLGA